MALKRIVRIALGSVCVALGAVGAFVPLLPTVPFLLVAAWCFAGSSERMHRWLLNQCTLGPHLRRYLERRAVKRAVRRYSLIALWCSLGVSAALVPNLHARIALLAVGVAVSAHLLLLKVE